MIITLETSMIFSVCIQIFLVSSMFFQGVINEYSMKKQWNINDSEVNTTESKKIKKFPSKLSMFQLCLSKESSTNHRRSSNQLSMFRRLPQQKFFIIKVCIKIIKVSSTSFQRVINKYSIKQHWNIIVSEISTKKVMSIMFASRSPKSYQKFLIGSSTINQSSSKGNQHSNDYSFINFNDLYRLHPNLRSVIIVSLKSHQRITTEEAMKHQWFRS